MHFELDFFLVCATGDGDGAPGVTIREEVGAVMGMEGDRLING